MDNWDEAEMYRVQAKVIWQKSHRVATRQGDANALDALAGLREELDELDGFRLEDLLAQAKEDRERMEAMNENMDEGFDMDEGFASDSAAKDKYEDDGNEMQSGHLGTSQVILPIRTDEASASANRTTEAEGPNNNANALAPATHKLRRQKSRGGAYHALKFAKSLPRLKSSSSRATLADMFKKSGSNDGNDDMEG